MTLILDCVPPIFAGAAVPLFYGFAFVDQFKGDLHFMVRNVLLMEPVRHLLRAVLIAGGDMELHGMSYMGESGEIHGESGESRD